MNDSPVHAPAGPIVVGTDGSPHARHAVLFALREAQLRGTGLRAVCAYDYTPARYTGYGWMAVPEGASTLYEQLHDVARQAVTDTVDELRQQLGGPHVEVEIIAEAGRPAQVLLDASKDASLLVVGTRGSGVWGRLTLGSTSTEVVHHAHLPVVVVPADSRGASS
ncbi:MULTISPECIES: universal stress protein [Streptomyces]|jgi:nucleotide-binding universal stress UspA family protein|uniref:universal stress protein n=1 Tax=Streptomyces TaxID=1883 RepID=UPI00068D1677|nr:MULTISPECIES: universal stress protein [Streptomyces]MDX3275845.1 universal stress protein [Streptomyces scabiei]MDX3847070.1 universal stress protein [Streptomyces europaeiscabiei]